MHAGAASIAAHLHRAGRHDDAHCNPTVPPATLAPALRGGFANLGSRSVCAFSLGVCRRQRDHLSTPNRPIVPVFAMDAPQHRVIERGPYACRETKLRPYSAPRRRHSAVERPSIRTRRTDRIRTSGCAAAGSFPTTGGARLGPKDSRRAVRPVAEQGYVADAGRTHAASLPSVGAETPTSLSTQGGPDGCSEAFPSTTLVEELPHCGARPAVTIRSRPARSDRGSGPFFEGRNGTASPRWAKSWAGRDRQLAQGTLV